MNNLYPKCPECRGNLMQFPVDYVKKVAVCENTQCKYVALEDFFRYRMGAIRSKKKGDTVSMTGEPQREQKNEIIKQIIKKRGAIKKALRKENFEIPRTIPIVPCLKNNVQTMIQPLKTTIITINEIFIVKEELKMFVGNNKRKFSMEDLETPINERRETCKVPTHLKNGVKNAKLQTKKNTFHDEKVCYGCIVRKKMSRAFGTTFVKCRNGQIATDAICQNKIYTNTQIMVFALANIINNFRYADQIIEGVTGSMQSNSKGAVNTKTQNLSYKQFVISLNTILSTMEALLPLLHEPTDLEWEIFLSKTDDVKTAKKQKTNENKRKRLK